MHVQRIHLVDSNLTFGVLTSIIMELNKLLAIKQLYSVIDKYIYRQIMHFEAKPYKSDYAVFLIKLFTSLIQEIQ